MTNVTTDIVAKLWNLCNVLKDDGVTYHQYVTELTYLLFLKMAKETGTEEHIPRGYRWDDLRTAPKSAQLEEYKIALIHLGTHGTRIINEIFKNATSYIKKSSTLSTLIEGIDKIEWYNAGKDDLGDVYEGLLEKNANEKKSGAGQYFTARALIESMVNVMRPSIDDIIQDPASGTGGFLIAADKYIKLHKLPKEWTESQKHKYEHNTFYGMEHVQDTYRMALMNMFLHGISSDIGNSGIFYGDTLTDDAKILPKSTLILSNPPFGTKKGGGIPERKDFPFPTSNKQFCFLQHIYLNLKTNGRAAVVLPDSALSDNNIGKHIRVDLMNRCNLHTVLRLPTGIFYAQGVKTCVLFFTKGKDFTNNTKETWVYDLRSNMPQYGKRIALSRKDFEEFESAFGSDPLGGLKSLRKRVDTGKSGRFRKFLRDEISAKDNNLNISWLQDKDEVLPEPSLLARDIIEALESTLEELRGLIDDIDEVEA